MKLVTWEQVALHQSEKDAWIVVDGRVYDVSNFMSSHPGGSGIILEALAEGVDLGATMRGADDEGAHGHSGAAFETLKKMCIGCLDTPKLRKEFEEVRSEGGANASRPNDFEVDLTKPLVFQVGHLGARYEEWVHQPIVTREGPRFFENDFMETLSRTSWWVIPIVWVPVVCLAEVEAVFKGLSPASVPWLMTLGLTFWSLLEYTLHRHLFHVRTSTYWMNTFHYLLHGCHHKHPMDRWRLVFPPALTAVFVAIILGTALLFIPYSLAMAIFGGALLGYIIYDLTHYYLHHGVPTSQVPRNMKRYHLNHHFKNQSDAFGISSAFWDWVFGTLPRPQKVQ